MLAYPSVFHDISFHFPGSNVNLAPFSAIEPYIPVYATPWM